MPGVEVARRINEAYPSAAIDHNETDVWITAGSLPDVAHLLKETADLDFAYLTSITAVDYVEYFELVYHLLSMRHNRSVVLKTRLHDRESPEVPSLVSVWKGADLQEREIWDLMGVHFDGHPNMKRILLWEGFDGHPLRKDYLG